MRKLVALFLAVVIAWFAVRMVATAQPLAPYVLRDALIVATCAALLFAFHTLPPLSPAATIYSWPMIGRILFAAGALTALIGALLPTGALPFASAFLGIGLVLTLLGAWWPGLPIRYAPPPFRWERSADGALVRRPFGAAGLTIDNEQDSACATRWLLSVALLMIVIGAVLRLLWIDTLPAACVAEECIAVLALVNQQVVGAPLLSWLSRQFFTVSADGLFSLRLAGGVIGALTLPIFFLFARRLTSNRGALLAVTLLALLPWHVLASRRAAPWIELPLWLSLTLWALIATQRGGDRRHWATVAIGLGLLFIAAPALAPAWLLWCSVIVVVAASGPRELRLRHLAVLLAAFLPFFLLVLPASSGLDLLWWSLFDWRSFSASSLQSASALAGAASGGDNPAALLPALIAALAVVGSGALLRYGRSGLLLLSGAGLLAADVAPNRPANSLLVLLIFLMAGAAVALEQITDAVQRAWHGVLRPGSVAAITFAVLVLVGVGGLIEARQRVDSAGEDGQNAISLAVLQVVAANISGDEQSEAILFAAPSLLDDAIVQLGAASAIEDGQLRRLDVQHDLPFTGVLSGGIAYLFPTNQPALLQLAQRVYPDAEVEQVAGENGATLLNMLRVPAEVLAASRGLQQMLIVGDQPLPNRAAAKSTGNQPLEFTWADGPETPFSALWQGSLLAPTAGDYHFSVDAPADANFSLLLDGRLVLDTSAGLVERREWLAQGWQRVDMRWRSGDISDSPRTLTVRWQPPGEPAQSIPASALFNPPLPNWGLLGEYRAGAGQDAPVLSERKDWLPAPDDTLDGPYRVRWQGKLAAPRAGETLLGVVTDGTVTLDVDSQRLVNFSADPSSGQASAEGVIYLAQGWHTIDATYATQGDGAEFKLYWQPPGSSPAPLPLEMLAPVTMDVTAGDLPLPPAPPLVESQLGDENFALNANSDLWQPQNRIPPSDLPTLPLEHLWTVGGCGSGEMQFAAPHGLVFDPVQRRVYVADTGNQRVVGLGLDGRSFEVQPFSAFDEPMDLAHAADGSLLVLDVGAPQIVRIDPSTGVASVIPLGSAFYRPRGLDVDRLGLIYVADTGGARVVVLARDGQQMAEFGGQGSALGTGQPVDVLATGRAIWSIAALDGRLWQLDTLGSMTAVQSAGTLDGPHFAALPDGRFLLSDPARGLILSFAASGQPLSRFDDGGALQQPTGLAALVEGQGEGEQVLIAAADTAACTVSLWRMPLGDLPR